MKNPNIAIMLRYYRKLRNYSIKDVSEILKKHNVKAATKTIYSWENATTQPSADTLMLLCEIYDIPNILEAFGYSKPDEGMSYTLSLEEIKMITEFRNHPEMHNAVKQLLGINNDEIKDDML